MSKVNYSKIKNSWNAKFSGVLLKHVSDHLSVLFSLSMIVPLMNILSMIYYNYFLRKKSLNNTPYRKLSLN